MRYRILSLLAAVLLTIGFGLGPFLMASPASASGVELCTSNQCLNAWNNGPEVNAYAEGYNNDTFVAEITGTLTDGTYVYGIQYGGGGNYNNDCVGDLGNSSTDARAGLYSNCTVGNVAWGANFTVDDGGPGAYCPTGTVGFHNSHWDGWLAPASSGNGAAFYLNSGVEYCFATV
jgi:hypothetical protein